jgi:hypothetical protein
VPVAGLVEDSPERRQALGGWCQAVVLTPKAEDRLPYSRQHRQRIVKGLGEQAGAGDETGDGLRVRPDHGPADAMVEQLVVDVPLLLVNRADAVGRDGDHEVDVAGSRRRQGHHPAALASLQSPTRS